MQVNFYDIDTVTDYNFKYAVIVAKYKEKWVFVRHKNRNTWEIPGGHKEEYENIINTASRELFEETGAVKFSLIPVCVYSVSRENIETFGKLFYSDINSLGNLPESEIAEVDLFDDLPDNLTYPYIQPFLFEKVENFLKQKMGT